MDTTKTVSNVAVLESSDQDFQVTAHILKDFNLDRFINHDELWMALKSKKYDTILADLDMDDPSDVNFLILLKSLFNEIPVIVYTSTFEMSFLSTAMKNRANNYILKTSEYHEILEAIKKAPHFETYRNIYSLTEDLDSHEIKEVRDSASAMAQVAANQFIADHKEKEIAPFSYEDIFRIFTGNIGNKVMLNIDKSKSKEKNQQRNKILVVDDESILRELIILTMQKEFKNQNIDISFIEAGNAQEAIDTYIENKEEIISCVIDMRMPMSNSDTTSQKFKQSAGLEVLRKIKTLDPRCECIILTAYSYTNELCECYRLGAFELCDKGNRKCYIDSIVESYKKALSNYQKHSDLSYTKLVTFRSSFGQAFVSQIMTQLQKERTLTPQESLNLVEFEYLLCKII